MRLAVLAFLGLLAPASSASAVEAVDPVRATLTTSSTMALAGAPWRYSITVEDGAGRPLAAKVRLQILLGLRVVACWKPTAMVRCTGARAGTWIAFKGRRAATIIWPRLSVAGRLTFRATVVSGTQTLRLRAPVTAQPRP